MPLQPKEQAPDFTLLDQEGKSRSLTDFAGKYVLLYFYPKDDTPGCTKEACNFRDRLNELKEHDVQVLGVSKDSVASHKKFAKKFDLNFPILSDEEKDILKKYGVWVEKSMFGKAYMGISRDSYLIDPKGNIVKHYQNVKPAKHVDEVLKDMKDL